MQDWSDLETSTDDNGNGDQANNTTILGVFGFRVLGRGRGSGFNQVALESLICA